MVKSSKLHFIDTGIACDLMGIREPAQLRTHPLRGAIFERWVASEALKQRAHCGHRTELFHYRDAAGLEVDLISRSSTSVILTESTSGATVGSDVTQAVDRLAAGLRQRANDSVAVPTRVVYGGDTKQTRGATEILPWHFIDRMPWSDVAAES